MEECIFPVVIAFAASEADALSAAEVHSEIGSTRGVARDTTTVRGRLRRARRPQDSAAEFFLDDRIEFIGKMADKKFQNPLQHLSFEGAGPVAASKAMETLRPGIA